MIYVVDTETTGIDPDAGAALLEVAAVEVPDAGGDTRLDWLVRYDGVIPPEAKAVHHINERDVCEGSGAWDRADVVQALVRDPGSIYAFHNANFDLSFLPELKAHPTICTWRCSLHLWPQAPGHGNQVLRYWLGLAPALPDRLAPHRALYDAVVTAAILERMLEERTAEDLVRLSTEPVVLTTIRFGKHKGLRWDEVETSYLRWILRDGSFGMDEVHTARTVLEARGY